MRVTAMQTRHLVKLSSEMYQRTLTFQAAWNSRGNLDADKIGGLENEHESGTTSLTNFLTLPTSVFLSGKKLPNLDHPF
jgi:hypothetical protein